MAKTSTSWKKGQIPNPTGRPPKDQSLTELMREYLYNIPKGQKKPYKEMFIEKTLLMAMKGDIAALKLIWNYLDGMPKQSINTEISLNNEIDKEKQAKFSKVLEDFLSKNAGNKNNIKNSE